MKIQAKLKFSLCIPLLLLVFSFFSCKDLQPSKQTFKSNFNSDTPRIWIGPEYWSNPMQDWQIADGWLECLVSKKNRNVHVLTKKLDTVKGNLKMNVSVQLFNTETTSQGVNWIGFSIGSKGIFKDYRDNAIFGKGLNVGVTTNGNLFIDEFPKNNSINIPIQKLLKKGIDLNVQINSKDNQYELTISIIDNASNKAIQQLINRIIPLDKIEGDLVLVSHYNSNTTTKSVSFKNWEFSGSKVTTYPEYAYGPILFSQYTLSKNVLKLTAQMAPVILNNEKVQLQIQEHNSWKTINEAIIDKDARTAQFKIEQWNTNKDVPYRLAYKINRGTTKKEEFYWEGIIRKNPIKKGEIIVAGFTGNDHLGFPNTDIFNQVEFHNPDILFFSGDQIYEPNGGFGVQRFPTDKAMLDYLRKWYMYGWAYRDLMKNRPTISITDDHDVFHGNIWGEGGRSIPAELGQGKEAQDYGGYKMPSNWVKMVERTQTSHLPDPFSKELIAQGIGTYYTDMVYGGISFAILEDRKFKSAPNSLLPKAKIENGWAQNKKFDMIKEGDVLNANLLGEKQLSFLNKWSSDWSYQSEMKVVLSQTIFANVATLPKEAMSGAIIPTLRILPKGDYPPNDYPVVDLDSNGWPQTGRNNAIKIIRKGFAFHLAGDQHLGSTLQYGVENWNDSGYAFCVPSISNHWPRRWYPYIKGKNKKPDKPRYTGEYKDGFGNRMTITAISNPTFTTKKPSRLYERATGFGIIKLNKRNRIITIECWPRDANPQIKDNQYDGWPIIIKQEENYGRKAKAYLPEINIKGLNKPVVQIIAEDSNEIVYSLRLNKKTFIPKIFDITTN